MYIWPCMVIHFLCFLWLVNEAEHLTEVNPSESSVLVKSLLFNISARAIIIQSTQEDVHRIYWKNFFTAGKLLLLVSVIFFYFGLKYHLTASPHCWAQLKPVLSLHPAPFCSFPPFLLSTDVYEATAASLEQSLVNTKWALCVHAQILLLLTNFVGIQCNIHVFSPPK